MERKQRETRTARRAHRESSSRHRAQDRKKLARNEPENTDMNESGNRLLTFTIAAGTGEIVRCEGLDANGVRYELSEDEKAALASESHLSLEEVLSRAFEAGMSCVLDDADAEAPQNDPDEPEEDAELRRLLLMRLIERSAARHLFRRDVLGRVILETLIEHSRNFRSKTLASTPGAGLQ
jgi:hypothetical protein